MWRRAVHHLWGAADREVTPRLGMPCRALRSSVIDSQGHDKSDVKTANIHNAKNMSQEEKIKRFMKSVSESVADEPSDREEGLVDVRRSRRRIQYRRSANCDPDDGLDDMPRTDSHAQDNNSSLGTEVTKIYGSGRRKYRERRVENNIEYSISNDISSSSLKEEYSRGYPAISSETLDQTTDISKRMSNIGVETDGNQDYPAGARKFLFSSVERNKLPAKDDINSYSSSKSSYKGSPAQTVDRYSSSKGVYKRSYKIEDDQLPAETVLSINAVKSLLKNNTFDNTHFIKSIDSAPNERQTNVDKTTLQPATRNCEINESNHHNSLLVNHYQHDLHSNLEIHSHRKTCVPLDLTSNECAQNKTHDFTNSEMKSNAHLKEIQYAANDYLSDSFKFKPAIPGSFDIDSDSAAESFTASTIGNSPEYENDHLVNDEYDSTLESSYSFYNGSSVTTDAADSAGGEAAFPYPACVRNVPRSGSELADLLSSPVHSPPNSRLVRVAILGLPNTGKSTLVNALLQDRVCSVSSKIHTTRCLARAAITEGDTQLVILDTPGIVTPEQALRFSLSGPLVGDCERSLGEADVLVVMVDGKSRYTEFGLHPRLLRLLSLHPTLPSVLVVNKVDLLKKGKSKLLGLTKMLTDGVVGGQKSVSEEPTKPISNSIKADALAEKYLQEELRQQEAGPTDFAYAEQKNKFEPTSVSLDDLSKNATVDFLTSEKLLDEYRVIHQYSDEEVLSGAVNLSEDQLNQFVADRKGWPKFDKVFLTSALTGSGVSALRETLLQLSRPCPWMFPSSLPTDQDPYQLAVMTVREKFLNRLKHQLPYQLRYELEHWELGDADTLHIVVRVTCPRASMVSLLVGAGGVHVMKLARQAEKELVGTFKTDVRLRINVVEDEPDKTSNRAG